MRKPEQNRENYGINPGRGSRQNESFSHDWANTNEHFSTVSDAGPHYGKGPKGNRRGDDRIKEDVCEMLYAHNEIDASEIEVLVKEGTVTLSGMVESRNLKRQVEAAIDGIPGVVDVQNNLQLMDNNSPMSGAKDIGDVKSLRS